MIREQGPAEAAQKGTSMRNKMDCAAQQTWVKSDVWHSIFKQKVAHILLLKHCSQVILLRTQEI